MKMKKNRTGAKTTAAVYSWIENQAKEIVKIETGIGWSALICLHHSLILSFYLPSLHPCPQGTVTERIKNKGKEQKHFGPICLRGIEEMAATSFLLPIIFIWPPDRARECAGAQETLRSVYGMPRCLLSSGDARCFILQHTRTHSLRHCPILPLIKQ